MIRHFEMVPQLILKEYGINLLGMKFLQQIGIELLGWNIKRKIFLIEGAKIS